MTVQTLTITNEFAGERIDKALSSIQPEWSRTQIGNWVTDGIILVNGTAVKAKYKVKVGDEIVVDVPEPEVLDVIPQQMDLEIVYEDADVLVVNKPRGMVVHQHQGI